jgi:5,10-methylene-tetrahydrofolate dehydrogenase/methenyl tetrahydrofolate cyclohydrolase
VPCCAQVGFESFGTDLPEDVSQEQLLKVVAAYNADPKVGEGPAVVVSRFWKQSLQF